MSGLIRLAFCMAVAADSACAAIVLSYSDFSSTAGLTLTGSAQTATTADGKVLNLTSIFGHRAGVARTTSPITLDASSAFSTSFQFRIRNPVGRAPGDGMTFFMAAGTTRLGANPGGWLGYGGVPGYEGVPRSVAIEFDTYSNGFEAAFSDQGNGNHVAVDANGRLTGYALASPSGVSRCDFSSATPYTAAGCMANGNLWSVTIGYDGSLLNVYLQEGRNPVQHLINNYAIDIGSLLATDRAYVGFTGATADANEYHDIVNWRFANTTELAPSAAPEPTTFALLSLGLVGLAATRRRRQ